MPSFVRQPQESAEQRDPRDGGNGLLQQLKLPGNQLLELGGHSSPISAGVRPALKG